MNGADNSPGIATGLLLVLVGVWVVSRTLIHDAGGQNLVDRVLQIAGGSGSTGSDGASSVIAQALSGPIPGLGLVTGPAGRPLSDPRRNRQAAKKGFDVGIGGITVHVPPVPPVPKVPTVTVR